MAKTAEEVIDSWIDPCGSDTGAGVLKALEDAGFAVVKLPEPTHVHSGRPAWAVLLDGEVEDVYPGDKGGVTLSGIETFEERDIPDLAAALLAAARHLGGS